MRKALPVIAEDVATLKRCFQHAHEGRKKLRLQMLYVLASEQAYHAVLERRFYAEDRGLHIHQR